MLQLLVFAGMQIPSQAARGPLGPAERAARRSDVLTLAQTGFAVAESFGAALAARIFVGMGDVDELDLPAPARYELVLQQADPVHNGPERHPRPA